ncbi:hypothetical protein BS78_05G137800 [Paspalum vaginatum]|nr:hypothetical protein BS78_05G137800 [Paspalum vaginatum]
MASFIFLHHPGSISIVFLKWFQPVLVCLLINFCHATNSGCNLSHLFLS